MNSIDFTINGHRYTNDPAIVESAGIPPEYQFIGYNAINALANYAIDVVAVGGDTIDVAEIAAAAAAASAASAVLLPSTSASSTSSILVGVGTKNFNMQPGKNFTPGMFVTIARTSAPSTIWMNGPLASYDPATGAASAVITRALGSSSSFTDWTVALSAPASPASGGAAVNGGSALTTTSLRYQEIQPGGAGDGFTVPTSVVGVQGPGLFTIRNRPVGYGWDANIRNTANGIIGFIRPGKRAYVDAGLTTYDVADASSIGANQIKQVSFSGIVAGTAGLWTKAVRLPSGVQIILVHGAALHAVVYDGGGNYSGTLLIRASLSTTGAEGTVAAVPVNDGTDNILITSVPNAGTTLQSVVLASSGAGLSLGTPVPTSVSAIDRIVELRQVTDAGGALIYVLGLMNSAGTSMATYGISVTTPGATALTVGAARTDVTTGSVGALLTDPVNPNVFMTVTASAATTLTIKAITLSAAAAQSPGGTATATITSGSPILVRGQSDNIDEFGPWAVAYTVTNSVKLSKLTLTGTAPALSAPASVNSAITTVSGSALGQTFAANSGYLSVAVTGTDASSRPLVEMQDFDMSGSAASPIGTITAVAMSAAATAVWIGPGIGTIVGLWQLSTASEVLVANTQPAGISVPNTHRLGNLAAYAQALLPPDPLTIKASRHRTTMRSLNRCMAIGDGSKPSIEYSMRGAYGEPTSRPIPAVAQLAYASFNNDAYTDSVWVSAGLAPNTNIILENLVLVSALP
jgi:hypothetical protein